MQQLENELAQTQTSLDTASHNLEEKEKALQNVCRIHGCALVCVCFPNALVVSYPDLGISITIPNCPR